jgi:putative ABC transport system substrate-binding protein
MIRRRAFISLVGGAAAWPVAAPAQPQTAGPMRRIGYLFRGSAGATVNLSAAFRKGLSESGYLEGRNVAVEYRFAEGQIEKLPALAADLVERRVAVIATPGGTATVMAAKRATSVIPIVFEIGTDPVEDGLVTSFNRPGGNVTGVTAINGELSGKRLELLGELVPKDARIGILIDGNSPFASEKSIAEIQAAAAALNRQIEILLVRTIGEVQTTFANITRKPIDALLIYASPVMAGFRTELVMLAARHAVPAMYWDRAVTDAGGLMSYGANGDDQFRQVGVYVGRILNGERPADLPVLRPAKFEFVINIKTAKSLGLPIPDKLLTIADEVIE